MSESPDNVDFELLTNKRQAFQYWERRRWIYLTLLIPPSVLGYLVTDEVIAGFGDKVFLSNLWITAIFTFCFIGANIVYSFAYVVEFGILGTKNHSGYVLSIRPLLFAAGCLFAMILAFGFARSIAFAKYQPI